MLDVGISNPVLPPAGSTLPTIGTNPPSAPTDTFSQIGSIVGAAGAGGVASWKFSATFSNSLKTTIHDVKAAEPGFGNKVKASLPGVRSLGLTTLKAGGIGALVSGGVSAVSNFIDVAQGKKTGAEAVGTAAADTISGGIGAMAGVATGGLATFALSSALGATPLLIVGIGIGAIGSVLASKLFSSSGAYSAIKNGLTGATSQ
jgi:hypothetical protein